MRKCDIQSRVRRPRLPQPYSVRRIGNSDVKESRGEESFLVCGVVCWGAAFVVVLGVAFVKPLADDFEVCGAAGD